MYLNDKLPEAETKADPFTLESLIAWLEKQDPSKAYNFQDTSGRDGGCVFFQYGVSLGHEANFKGYCKTLRGFGTHPEDPFLSAHISSGWPRTFGAALSRARSLAHGSGE